MLDTAVDLAQDSLSVRVERTLQDEFSAAAVIGVDLAAFDDPDYVELINRASSAAMVTAPRGHHPVICSPLWSP